MRTKLMSGFFAVLVVLVLSFSVYAYDNVQFNDSYGTTAGGEYEMWSGDLSQQYVNTFCVEQNEYLNFSNTFTVGGYETAAPETAFLYYLFATETLPYYNFNDQSVRVARANMLQEAIWYFQGPRNVSPQEAEAAGGNLNWYIRLGWMTDQSINNTYPDWEADPEDFYINQWNLAQANVRILDLYWEDGRPAQDVLGLTSVPEPTTLLLLGLGLFGLGLARKLKK